MKYILASASPRRIELIRQAGLDVMVVPSDADEHVETSDPEQLVMELSKKKAQEVASRFHDGEIVIGADTCVCVGESILGKPATKSEAMAMLAMLQGNVHYVYTGVTLLRCEDNFGQGAASGTEQAKDNPVHAVRDIRFVEQTAVHVYPMTAEEIAAYAETGEPMDKAGAYGIQGGFARYIEKIEGDYYNVMGLPVGRLYQTMKEKGLWPTIS